MKKVMGALLIVMTCSSYAGFGIDCTKPSIAGSNAPANTAFSFACTNDSKATFNGFTLTPVVSSGGSVTTPVISACTHGSNNIQPGDSCTVNATFSASAQGNYTVDFNESYGGDEYSNIFCSTSKGCMIANVINFTSTNTPYAGASQMVMGRDTNHTMYAVNNGELYSQNSTSGVWSVLSFPSGSDNLFIAAAAASEGGSGALPLTLSVAQAQAVSDSLGNIYALMNDGVSVWEYKTSGSWVSTSADQISGITSMTELVADNNGNIYGIVNGNALAQYHGGSWNTPTTPFTGATITCLVTDGTNVYALTQNANSVYDVWEYSYNNTSGSWGWTDTALSASISPSDIVSSLIVDTSRNLYVIDASSDGATYKVWESNSAAPIRTWANITHGLAGPIDSLTAQGTTLYAITGSAGSTGMAGTMQVYSQTNLVTSWTNTNITGHATIQGIYNLILDSGSDINALVEYTNQTFDVLKYGNTPGDWTSTEFYNTDPRAFIFTLTADHSGDLYATAYNGALNVWKDNGMSWSENNTGLPFNLDSNISLIVCPTFAIDPNSGNLLAITPLGIELYSNNSWVNTTADFTDPNPVISNAQYFWFYSNNNGLYLDLGNADDTTEDLIQYNTQSQSWQSTNLPSDLTNQLGLFWLVTGANNLLYVMSSGTYSAGNIYDVYTYGNNSWLDTDLNTTPTNAPDFLPTTPAPPQVTINSNGIIYALGPQPNSPVDLPNPAPLIDVSYYKNGAWVETNVQNAISNLTYMSQIAADTQGNVYVIAVTSNNGGDYELWQYNGRSWRNTNINQKITASSLVLNQLAITSNGNVYAITRTGSNVSNYAYDVWAYNGRSWLDTSATSIMSNAAIYALASVFDGDAVMPGTRKLTANSGNLYAATQSGTYVYSPSTGWLSLNTTPTIALVIKNQGMAALTRTDGVYQF